MRKLKYVILSIVLVFAIFAITGKVQAAEAADFKTLQTIKIETPAGEYKTGDTITFVATFEKDIATLTPMQCLKIRFSETNMDREIVSGTAVNNTITYQYTIKDTDKGTLIFKEYSIRALTASDGAIKTTGFDNDVVITVNSTSGAGNSGNLTWSEDSKVKMSLTRNMEKYYDVVLNVSGISGDKDHYVYISNSKTAPKVVTSSTGRIENADFNFGSTETSLQMKINKYAEKSGDIYVWLYESQSDSDGKVVNKCIVSARKLQRPSQNKLGLRINGYFFSTDTSIFVYEPIEDKTKRKVNLKIGTVTDKTILRAIKNGEADCLTKLLNYAKSAKSPIYTGTISLGSDGKSITSNMNLVDDQYYYVYMTLDNGSAAYYPVEDVSLYQAAIGETIGKNLWDYLDGKFKWNIEDDGKTTPVKTTKDTTKAQGKLPQTGVSSIVIISILGIAIIVAVVCAKKYKKYDIKY